MLTSDLVRVTKRSGKLHVTTLTAKARPRAEQLAQVYLSTAAEHVGLSFGQLQEAWDAVEVAPKELKLAGGLRKLIEDACEFDERVSVEPRVLRSEVFLAASAERKRLGAEFDRQAVISAVAQTHQTTSEAIEAGLFADLRSEHCLNKVPNLAVKALLDGYDMAQYQAVLLRAVHVTAHVECRSPSQYRALFRALKFRRLLHVIHPEAGGYRIEIDGPFSLFESVTKYGLQLSMVFPVLRQCDSLKLVAEIRWGKAKQALRFEYEQAASCAAEPGDGVSDDVAQLLTGLKRLESPFQVRVNEELLELPGVGMCVPDLVFQRGAEKVYLEVMGYWSRDALWKRIELAQAGLPHRILFAASTRLRVSEEVLEPLERAALYVYKGTMNAKAVAEQVARLWSSGR